MEKSFVCGVSGFFHTSGSFDSLEAATAALASMTDSLTHRGPDDRGLWLDAQASIALGHRRLSILDTSPAGAQPMHSRCGRYVLTYNGEIYNSQELKNAVNTYMEGAFLWRGHSDTEAFLETCAAFGVREAVQRSLGMFAFALWDKKERTLTLGCDRFGVKPLYWAQQGHLFLFGSELKALRRHPAFTADIDRSALAAFLRCNYLPAPMAIFAGVRKLRPGCLLTVSSGHVPAEHVWWSSLEVALDGIGHRVTSHKDALDELHDLLRDAVKRRMVADVPVGAFLSGGIDSSLVVALMQEHSMQPVNTFTIGFEEAKFNEAPYAKAVAESLGTKHQELLLTAQGAVDIITKLPAMYDEPFADSSQIPTHMLSTLARREVTVALSGDGGDELFAGYAHHNGALWNEQPLVASRASLFQRQHFGCWLGRGVVLGSNTSPDMFVGGVDDSMFHDEGELRQYIDTMHFLPGSVLTKVDRASMAVALEVRPPLLDHRIYAHAWRMPPELRRAAGKAKWPLRHILDRYISPVLTERPKRGFSVPVALWLRGHLRDWAEALLEPVRLRQEGWLNQTVVTRIWHEHLAGRGRPEWLWGVLAFQAWLEAERKNTVSPDRLYRVMRVPQ